MSSSLFVGVDEVCQIFDCSKTKGYDIIKKCNKAIKEKNPNYVYLSGRTSRAFLYEECMVNSCKQ